MTLGEMRIFNEDTEALLKRLQRDTTVRMLSTNYQDEAA